jgi:pyruvate/2-oxoglutarate/acetoin dehydrogenase E1 component
VIYARALGDALRGALAADRRVILLGEDIADPYGGAFKVTRGLSTAFPDRVRATPISEGAITGVAAGLALAGYRPVVEIMFGDFLTLCFDQIVNHIVKYGAMYDGGVRCPVIVRTPSGGGRGYGPTHSQSLEKHFLGVPHLQVVAASLWHDPKALFARFLAGDAPVLHIEHKLLYPLTAGLAEVAPADPVTEEGSPGMPPTMSFRLVARESCRLTVIAYGYQAELVRRVVERLGVEEELFVELLVPAQIAPVDYEPLVASAAVTGRVLTVEEGASGWSWGTEIASELGRRLFGSLRRAPDVLTSSADVIPSAGDREAEVLVGERHIEAAIREAAR